MKLPSTMKHNFSKVPQANIQRSQFNRSHGYKTTFDSGYLVPVYVDEALPGDTFSLNMTSFARLATPIVPIMDNMYLDTFFFAVPNRLIWSNWEKFNGSQDDPGDSTDFLVPTMDSPASVGHLVGSLSDYFGIPTDVPDLTHSSLWHRAYNLIYNEWFRDENLQDSVVVDIDDGPDTSTDYVPLRRGKRHDYFTSALPWAQKGDAVTLPLGTSAPVLGLGTSSANTTALTAYNPVNGEWGTDTVSASGGFLVGASESAIGTGGSTAFNAANTAIYADLSSATASTINALRQSFQIQKLYERDARGGTRYTEIIKSHFGVISPDQRLQRPEYLGGNSTSINISPISQTSSTDATTPQGNLAAIGTASNYGAGFTKSFTEHCTIIGLVNVRADLNYQQGLNKMFSRQTRWDYYWPALSHIGEQAILNKEIYAQGSVDAAADAAVFGFQERYAEYRYKPSQITGQFRSTYSTPLDYWHLAQEFSSIPTLNATFIEDTPPIDRVVANATEPEFLFDAYIDLKTARPMPTYSVPGLIDHF